MNFGFFNNKKVQLICVGIALLAFSTIWFYLGRKTVKDTEPGIEIVYLPGETIHDSIPYPEPYQVVKPTDTADIIRTCVRDGIYSELFPERVVTEYVEITKEDTAEFIRDWGTKRRYSEILFDVDTLGKCVVYASVQYNRLLMFSYKYTPVIKAVTITENRVKHFSPYVGVGAFLKNNFSNHLNVIPTINAGFFIKEKYGLHLQYCRDFGTRGNIYGASLLYKF